MGISRAIDQFDDKEVYTAGNALVATELSEPGSSAGACPALYPANLLSQQPSHRGERDRARGWWLAHTRPRQEKSVASALFSRSVGYFLPLVTRKSLTRGRVRVARIPLFPGYVFVRGGEDDRLSVLKTNRVVTVQPVPDGEQLRRDLLQFAVAIANGAPLVREARLVAGELVRIKAGHFRDTEGVVLRRNGRTRLQIAVNFLQQGASLEVEDCLLEPV